MQGRFVEKGNLVKSKDVEKAVASDAGSGRPTDHQDLEVCTHRLAYGALTSIGLPGPKTALGLIVLCNMSYRNKATMVRCMKSAGLLQCSNCCTEFQIERIPIGDEEFVLKFTPWQDFGYF